MGFTRELAMAVPESRVRFFGHPEHTHQVPHIVHMVMGRGHLTVDGSGITLEPRTSVLLAPGVPHALELDRHSIALGPFLSPRNTPVERVRRLGVVPAITDLIADGAADNRTDRGAGNLVLILGSDLVDHFHVATNLLRVVHRLAHRCHADHLRVLGGRCRRFRRGRLGCHGRRGCRRRDGCCRLRCNGFGRRHRRRRFGCQCGLDRWLFCRGLPCWSLFGRRCIHHRRVVAACRHQQAGSGKGYRQEPRVTDLVHRRILFRASRGRFRPGKTKAVAATLRVLA